MKDQDKLRELDIQHDAGALVLSEDDVLFLRDCHEKLDLDGELRSEQSKRLGTIYERMQS
ncbi:MAG: hypothetical protein ACPG4T_01595 [Nannocystaceae bacterium]